MAKPEPKKKTFDQYTDEIASLKAKRGVAWRKALPDDVDTLPPDAGRMAALRAENTPEVLALTGEIAILRAEQMAAHGDPTLETEA